LEAHSITRSPEAVWYVIVPMIALIND